VKNIYIFILSALLMSIQTHGQSYSQAVGLRMGSCSGITYRKIMSNDLAGELSLSGYHHSTVITFLVEKHRPMLIHDHFPVTFFYGAGIHAGFGSAYHDNDWMDDDYSRHSHYYGFSPKAGIDGFASLEYELDRYPFSLSLECKPYVEFFDFGFPGLHLPAIAVTARYTF
jgi:hypothetical protein